MSKILFKSLVSERIGEMLQLVQGTFKEPCRGRQEKNAELNLQICKIDLSTEQKPIAFHTTNLSVYGQESLALIINFL